MDNKVNWGILGVADIAVKRVIPAMQRGELSQVVAIASRNLKKAQEAAEQLGIARSYGSYEDLLADPEVEAVYNPLPNHLHVPWSIKAAEAGKHVLCEKPISLTVEEAISLLRTRDRTGMKIEEAFMVRTHPQWLGALDLIRRGSIGVVRSVVGYFSYYLRDPQNVRNIFDYGGGALMDIGCYLVYTSRVVFGEEPTKVLGLTEADPKMRSILEFESSNQYTVQGDLFSKSIRQGTELPVTLEGSVRNMAVIEALFRSGKSDRWETPAVPELEPKTRR
jgi:predicted dehydrogenase